jgi:hypothetical protein
MTLASGTRLGPYEILSAIGAGGMGEVYKARDTRLDRIVAIKVLPAHLSDGREIRERFEREARTISNLNHPHICTLHDIGNQDGVDFLVMEYREGETLAQRLEKGALPLDQAIRRHPLRNGHGQQGFRGQESGERHGRHFGTSAATRLIAQAHDTSVAGSVDSQMHCQGSG